MVLDRLTQRMAAFLRDAAVVALIFMMMITVVDIGLRWTINQPIFGAFELVEFSLVGVVFLALPFVFEQDRHIVVSVFDGFWSRAVRRLLDVVGILAGLAYVGLIGWYMVSFARDAWEFGDRTMDLGWPVIYFWVPVFFGVIASILVCLVLLLRMARRRRG